MQKIRFYLISLVVLLSLGVIALVYVLNAFAPDKASSIVLVYCLIALIGFAVATLIGFYLRKFFGQREMLSNYAAIASRQGLWLALILGISLFLTRHGLFTWINAGLLVFTFIFFESYLLTKDKSNETEN